MWNKNVSKSVWNTTLILFLFLTQVNSCQNIDLCFEKNGEKNHFDPKVWPFVPRAQLWESIMIFWAHGNFSSGFLWISLYSSDSRTNRPVINLHLFYFCEPPKLYFGLQRDQTTASQITFKFKRSLNWKLLLPNKWLFVFRLKHSEKNLNRHTFENDICR